MQQNNILIGQYVIKEEKGFYEVIDIETKETIMRYERLRDAIIHVALKY